MLNINLKKTSEMKFLTKFIKKGKKNARSLTRARILLLARIREKGILRSLTH